MGPFESLSIVSLYNQKKKKECNKYVCFQNAYDDLFFFFCIFFSNIMKQKLNAFLQTYVDLNFSFIFLQNLSLFKKYILVFFFGLLYSFFFIPKLDFFN